MSIEKLYVAVQEIVEGSRAQICQTANLSMVRSFWEIGELIVREEQQGTDRAAYGKQVIESLSKRLTIRYGRGFNRTNLWYMRQFYQMFPILHALRGELSWTHYRLLIKVQSQDGRDFYMQETASAHWSTRTLERQINSLYYERMLEKGKPSVLDMSNELGSNKPSFDASSIIKDPYVLDFLGLKNDRDYLEKELEQGLIDKLQEFLLELGKGFSFVTRQYRITTEELGKHFYVDLVFYNYILKCFLLIDLKANELTHQDIGQMDFYVRYFEGKVRQNDDNPTIGLILCTKKDKTIVKYSLLKDGKQVFASKYRLYLPSEDEFRQELEREKQALESERTLLGQSRNR